MSCLRSFPTSPQEPLSMKKIASFSPSPSPILPPWKVAHFVSHSPTKPAASLTSSSERVRSVLGVLNDNQFASLLTPTTGFTRLDSGIAGTSEIWSLLKGQSRQKIGINLGKEDKPQDSLLKGVEFSCHNENGNDMAKPASTPLRGKRPPKLNIPEPPIAVTPGVSELAEEQIKEVYVEGSHFGVFCKKGRKEFMEDVHRVIPNFQGNPKQAFFGVFDGHGGRKAADFVAENLAQNIVSSIENGQDGEDYIEKAVSAAYLATDAEFLRKGVSSGASCVTALVRDGFLVVANVGDCRAVMSRGGKAEVLTSDHKAGREDERQRIESLGGYIDCFNGVWRVQGTLAVSRGFGDRHLKQWISAEPGVKKLPITPDCEFLILASDGLWDKVSNEEAVDCARALLDDAPETGYVDNSNQSTAVPLPTLGTIAACKKLVEMAANRGSLDDISVVIAQLQHFR